MKNMTKLPARIVMSLRLFQGVLWLGVCDYAKASSPLYELTVKAWFGCENEVQVHELIQPDIPFFFMTNGEHGHLRISGTLREDNSEHFYLEVTDLEAFNMTSSGRMCDSQVTKKWK